MKKILTLSFIALAAAWFLTSSANSSEKDLMLPEFNKASFSSNAMLTNPYFPVSSDQKRIYRAEGMVNGEFITERFVHTAQNEGPMILGIKTQILLDEAYENDLIVEKTLDYFAQDDAGNVWYMGEDVINYVYDENKNLLSTNTSSSWRAGVNNALPGYQMPADAKAGMNYFQEYAAKDEALDYAKIVESGLTITIGETTYDNVIKTLEGSTLDADFREFKYYAPNVGLIQADEGLNADYASPTLIFYLRAK